MEKVRFLAVGDVCYECGCNAALRRIPEIKRAENIDFVIVNGENSAAGNGITPQSAQMLFAAGADVITGGNHSFRRKEVFSLYDSNPCLLRPHNVPFGFGGGYCLCDMGRHRVAVINLLGRAFLEKSNAENPFLAADALLQRAAADRADFVFVDFHAEATGEKRAMGFYLDGKVTAVFGTHTHVQTADAQILPQGTGYITDLGMTGTFDSVLGIKKEIIVSRFKDGTSQKFEPAAGSCKLCGCVFEADERSGRTVAVKLISV